MFIGIDANEANLTANRVGVNQYAFELLKALYSLKTDHTFIIYLKNAPKDDLPKARKGWTYRVIPFPKLWTQTRLPWDLYTHTPRPDLFFSMGHYAPRFSPVPTVVAIMDLGFLQTPDQFTPKDFNQLKHWTEYSVRQAKKVIAISEHTKKDVIKEYKKSAKDVVVTPLAYDKQLFTPTRDQKILTKYGISEPYLLYLGSLKPSKNLVRLVKAFAQIDDQKLKLVIAGKKAWLFEEIFEEVRKLKLIDRVIFTGFVEEKEKPVLMTHAAAFVMPSLYEGFGIPVLEAMACGTPVVVATIASLPEVGGDAAIYVDPLSVESIAKGISTALGPGGKTFAAKGAKRVQSFSWSKCAQETLTCLETVMANN